MAGLVGTFGSEAVANSFATMGLKNEEWKLGYKNGAPTLYADVTGSSIQDVGALKSALEQKEIDFSQRTRSTNQAEVIEVMGDDFSKLTKIIGEDVVNQMHIDVNSPAINSVRWQEGMTVNSMPVIYTDITNLAAETTSALSRAMGALNIEGSERVNSQGRRMLEVKGTSIPTLTAILPGVSGNSRVLGMDGQS